MSSSASSAELTPADALLFVPKDPQTTRLSATLTLRNKSASQPLAFIIKTTSLDQFSIEPPRGVIRAGSSTVVTLTTASTLTHPSTEKILVQSIHLPKEQATGKGTALLSQARLRDITHHKLLCRVVEIGPAIAAMEPPTPPLPTTPRKARSRSRTRSGENKASLNRSNSTINSNGRASHLEQLQREREADDDRRKRLLTYRDDSAHNHRCFNCGDDTDRPSSICLDFSIYVCNVCSTAHRGMEHRVKSIKMSKFTDNEVDEVLRSGGNAAAYSKWRKTYTPTFKIPGDTPEQRSHQAIWLTFFQHAWTGEAPPSNLHSMPAPASVSRRGTTQFKGAPNATTAPSSTKSPTLPAKAAGIPLTKLAPSVCKTWRWLKDVTITAHWTGDELCIPSNDGFERQLRDKVAFVQKALSIPADSSGSVFSGTYLLRSVDRAELPEADLFMALEVMHIRSTGAREAENHIEDYALKIVEANASAHPLLLIALARCVAKAETPSSTKSAKELLVGFGKTFAQASQKWMSDNDRELLKTAAPAANPNVSTLTPQQIEWERLKERNNCQSPAMDELLKLVGLGKVKQSAIQLFKSALAIQKMTPEMQTKNRNMTLNFCFTGNPGTGKTTVAKLFARILVDSKMRRNDTIEICSPQQLKDDGPKEFKQKIEKATGGVVFIDEAYELDPAMDPRGKPIMAELLLASEELRHDLSFILAGYEDDIQNKLYAHNEGLPSRFVQVQFDDFDESDLQVLWNHELKERGWAGEDASVCVIACRRLARAAGRKGFGNARAVRQLAEVSIQAAMARPDYDGTQLTINVIDIIGERPSKNPKLDELLKEIDAKIGWTRIKERVRELVDVCDANYERELAGAGSGPNGKTVIAAPSAVALNRLFLGNPGTGKTTFASYYGRLLKHLHLLSNGDVVKKTAGDFVGEAVGQSQSKTNDILKQAKGKILIIDEAYNLNDNLYGKQVLDVLVEKIQGTDSDDIAVIMIGYEAQMVEMFRVQNTGLTRRFPIEFAFYFDDYTEIELLQIFAAACAKQNIETSTQVDEEVVKYLAKQKNLANFGNAGAVEQLLKNAVANATTRHRREKQSPTAAIKLKVDDLASETVRRSGGGGETKVDPLAALDGLYRMDNIRTELSRIQMRLKTAERDGDAQPPVGHFVFRGSPGTGKTTVARVMGSILFHMGVLSSARVVETSGLNMTGEYVGATKKKVETQLQEARGAILFIDEAYEMGKGAYGEEALTTLVAAMTDPTYKGTVVIIAGYPRDVDVMLNRNAGLKSRFTRFFDFQDWELDDCIAFMLAKAAKERYSVDGSVQLVLHDLFKQLRELPGFGNGRDGGYVWDCLMECRAVRVCNHPEVGERTIQASDAREATTIVLKAREPPPPRVNPGMMHHLQQFPHQSMPGFPHLGMAMPFGSHPGFMNMPYDMNGAHFHQQFQQHQQFQPHQQLQQQPQFQQQQQQHQQQRQSQPQLQLEVEETRRVEMISEAKELQAEKEVEFMKEKQADARDAGVTDQAWQELQKAKEDYKQLLDQMLQEEAARKAREEAERKLREYEALMQLMKEEAERKAKEEAERRQREYEEELRRIQEEKDRKAREEAERKLREYHEKLKREQEEAERKAREEAERKRLEHEANLERLRRAEEEARRVKEEAERKLREYQAKQERLRQIGNCPAGYQWYQSGGGWRCGGGSHFVSDAELQQNFTY